MHIQFDFVQQCIQISTRINSTSVHMYICVCFIRNVSSIRIYILIDPIFNKLQKCNPNSRAVVALHLVVLLCPFLFFLPESHEIDLLVLFLAVLLSSLFKEGKNAIGSWAQSSFAKFVLPLPKFTEQNFWQTICDSYCAFFPKIASHLTNHARFSEVHSFVFQGLRVFYQRCH